MTTHLGIVSDGRETSAKTPMTSHGARNQNERLQSKLQRQLIDDKKQLVACGQTEIQVTTAPRAKKVADKSRDAHLRVLSFRARLDNALVLHGLSPSKPALPHSGMSQNHARGSH